MSQTDIPAWELLSMERDPIMLFEMTVRNATGGFGKDLLKQSGNRISYHGLFLGPWHSDDRLTQDPAHFFAGIARYTDVDGDLRDRLGGLYLSVSNHNLGNHTISTVGFMLRRDELGKHHLDISRGLHVPDKSDDTAVAVFTGNLRERHKGFGPLLHDILSSPTPHAVLEASPHYAVRPAGRVLC